MTFPDKRSILLALSLPLAAAQVCAGQATGPAGMSPRLLPSVVKITVQRSGGVRADGTAFLGVRDGLLVAALHVLKDATKVTATFPNGEEFDCAGVVDKDERRNLALVRIKAFGRPVLKVSPGELAVGDKAFIPVVKDGAFGVVEASVAEVVIQGGTKFYRLTGEIPDGNAGSPLVNAAGDVVGLHVTVVKDGQNVEMALPSAYILGLEPSLPVQPWTQAAAQNQPGAPAAAPANEAVDVGLAVAMTNIHDWWVFFEPFSQNVYRMTRYASIGHLDLYKIQSQIDAAISQAGWLKPADPLREKLVQAALQLLAKERQGIEFDINCWLMNKDVGPGKRIPQAEDAGRRATALFGSIPSLVAPLQADFRQLAQGSPAFVKALPIEMQYFLGVAERKSKLVLGAYLSSGAPMQLLNLLDPSLADVIGLRAGDLIVSAGGRTFKPTDDIEEFKLLIEQRPGGTLDVVVTRGGKPKTLQLKIPADVMQKYARGGDAGPRH